MVLENLSDQSYLYVRAWINWYRYYSKMAVDTDFLQSPISTCAIYVTHWRNDGKLWVTLIFSGLLSAIYYCSIYCKLSTNTEIHSTYFTIQMWKVLSYLVFTD